MKLYVVRHGESENNQKGVWTGWYDAQLTKKGRHDAVRAGEILKHHTFDKIYASDLSRARETAEIAIPGCFYETSELLREIDVGTLENQKFSVLSEIQKSRITHNGYADFGGESKEQLECRIRSFVQKFESPDCYNVAVFSHSGWMRALLDLTIGMRIPRTSLCCRNCTVAVFEYTDSWQLHSWINPD